MKIIGVDFTSAPRRQKPITVAHGVARADVVEIDRVDQLVSFEAFEDLLDAPGPWVGAFDFPFGLPRAFVVSLGWPTDWIGATERLASLERPELRDLCKAYCDARPVGKKLAHRAADLVARSSSSMKWVHPPVAFMLQTGAPRLMRSGVTIPGLFAGDPERIALEGYPALVAREVTTASYKNDARIKQTPALEKERRSIVHALEHGALSLGVRVKASRSLFRSLVEDATGDLLDAVLCAVQATWAASRRRSGFGLPASMDPLEGWIVTTRPSGG